MRFEREGVWLLVRDCQGQAARSGRTLYRCVVHDGMSGQWEMAESESGQDLMIPQLELPRHRVVERRCLCGKVFVPLRQNQWVC
ncbi:hypothetical protein RRG08_008473 [Elysia crispata]|uniref:Uncharacterized protein n=1 Tax=Elysia crispata TaxID=231223 RepID=A0AAE1DCQ4_9GAST|nr:hypothetical protein RRG08_008473 [Elysia crispata]